MLGAGWKHQRTLHGETRNGHRYMQQASEQARRDEVRHRWLEVAHRYVSCHRRRRVRTIQRLDSKTKPRYRNVVPNTYF